MDDSGFGVILYILIPNPRRTDRYEHMDEEDKERAREQKLREVIGLYSSQRAGNKRNVERIPRTSVWDGPC